MESTVVRADWQGVTTRRRSCHVIVAVVVVAFLSIERRSQLASGSIIARSPRDNARSDDFRSTVDEKYIISGHRFRRPVDAEFRWPINGRHQSSIDATESIDDVIGRHTKSDFDELEHEDELIISKYTNTVGYEANDYQSDDSLYEVFHLIQSI